MAGTPASPQHSEPPGGTLGRMEDRVSTVWMVHALTGMAGQKGQLTLRSGALVFRPDSRGMGDSVFELVDLSRVRRVRGSPILEITQHKEGAPRRLGFYFIKPPSLDDAFDRNYLRRRKARKDSLNALRVANADFKGQIERWVETILEAREAARVTGPGKRRAPDTP